MEKKSAHPIGKAIYSFAKGKNPQKLEVTQLDESDHSGITGQIQGENYTIGSLTLMRKKGIYIPKNIKPSSLAAGDHRVFIARENKIVGFMVMTDPLRADAYRTIKALNCNG